MAKKIFEPKSSDRVGLPTRARALGDQKGEWIEKPHSESLESSPRAHSGGFDDIFRSFARQISRLKRLSEEEEHDLGQRVKQLHDVEAQKKLVLHNMRLALKMAHQYRREWTNLMDLVQEASAGLAIAAKKWDPDMGVRYGTYAAYWIRAQLTKFLMTNSRLIHTGNTRAGRKIYYSLPQVRKKLLLQGKEPTVELIAKEVNEPPEEVALVLSRLQGKEASLSQPLDDEGTTTLEDTIGDTLLNPEQAVSHKQIQELIKDLISGFEATIENERDLAIWRENLIANEPVNLVELGKRYNVSKQRMGQLAVRLKRAFRRFLMDRLGPNTQLSWLFREDMP